MMSNRIIGAAALALCAGLSSTANAQMFQRISGDEDREIAYSIETTTDGGYITTGFRDSDPTSLAEDVLITKHKPDGSIEWQRKWVGPGRDIGYSVQQTFDGGYIVAAETTSSGDPMLGILLIRLDSTGGFVWNRYYTGSFMSDPIHGVDPGVALDQGNNGQIYVTGNAGGVPLILGVGPGGGLIFEALYTDTIMDPDLAARFAFTDIKFDNIDATLVVSGTTIRTEATPPAGAFIPTQDAFMMRTTGMGVPIWSWNYDFPVDLDPDNEFGFNVRETGNGLDIGPNGDIILNGLTDFGGPATTAGTHLVSTDRAGFPVWGREYSYFAPDGIDSSPMTAYAAVRYDDQLNIVQTGRVRTAGVLHTWESLVDFGGAPIWFWEYGDESNFSQGESVVPTDCGYAMAGQYTFFPPVAGSPFTRGETYLVKNNDDGKTGCLEQQWEFAPDFDVQIKQNSIQPNYVDENLTAENWLTASDASEEILCYDDSCGDPAPCPCDINGDGILDLTDIGMFVACFTGMLPCGDLAAPFGVWDLADVTLFIDCFTTPGGCP